MGSLQTLSPNGMKYLGSGCFGISPMNRPSFVKRHYHMMKRNVALAAITIKKAKCRENAKQGMGYEHELLYP